MRYVVLIGNPADGFVVVGPFESAYDATTYRIKRYLETERDKSDCWILELHKPADDNTE
jgi:hypothetical protein